MSLEPVGLSIWLYVRLKSWRFCWRTSTLRADLNRDFLNSFDEAGDPILMEIMLDKASGAKGGPKWKLKKSSMICAL